MIRTFAVSTIAALFAAASSAAAERGDAIGAEKKIIEWGGDQPDTAYLREHIADMERLPFDGVILRAHARTKDGDVVSLDHAWGRRFLAEDDLRPAMDDLRATKFSRFTDNFLRFNVTPGDVDWFDPEFDAVISNARLAAKVAAAGKLRGFMLDTEMYQSPVWVYHGQKYCAEKGLEEYTAQARKRGAQFMQAIQSELPQPVVMMTFAPSLILQTSNQDLENHGYGLLPAFVDGMLEAAGPGALIVDACEGAYSFRDVAQFRAAREAFRAAGRKLSGVPRRYRQHMRLAFGLWMDELWGTVGWFPDDPEKNRKSPLEFEYALHRALAETDRYVWVYSEKVNWWTGQHLPPAYVEAVRNARAPHDPAWRTSRDVPGGRLAITAASSMPGHDDEATFAPLWPKHEKIMDLPKMWMFRLDPQRAGEQERWFAADADESAWKPIAIGKFWEEQGYPDYDGVAWYRVRVAVPAVAAGRQLLLSFGAADETAKVWVNGQLAGEFGLLGFTWHERFEIDAARFLRPGENNLIAVKVEDSIGMGGLWKSVILIAPT